MKQIYWLVLLIIFFGSYTVDAQNLEQIGKRDPVKVSGSLGANSTAYHATGIQNRRDPFYWLLSANLTFDIYEVTIPFSATFSQQNRTFTQPFNQYGLSPHYKAITLHAGYRSLQFSDFTLGGNIFLGGGIEVAPQHSPLRFTALYGRFAKAVAVAQTDGVIVGQPAYERWGYGAKIEYSKPSTTATFSAFRARDDESSIPALPDSIGIKPAENVVFGFLGRQQLTAQLALDGEYALSAYTTDTRLEETSLDKYRYANHLGPLFTPNTSSQFNNAFQVSLSFTANLYQLRVSYRRIDPEYKTMGSVFLNNDLEDITANISWRMLKNKLNLTVGGGLQRNNLNKALLTRMTRTIGNLTFSYAASQRLNFSGGYSNYLSNTRFNNQLIDPNRLQLNQSLDSLNYNQITSNANLTASFNAGSKTERHVFFLNGNYQTANDNQANHSTFYNANGGYQFGHMASGVNATASVNYTHSVLPTTQTQNIGPTASLSKSFFDKTFRSSLSAALLQAYTNRTFSGRNIQLRLANQYTFKKKHSLSLDLAYIARRSLIQKINAFSEFRGSLNYGYAF